MDCSEQPVVVAVRIRPLTTKENNKNEVKTVIKQIPNEPQLLIAGGRGFAFDYILNESAEQCTVYEDIIKPRLEYLYQGYNSAIIAYGQTGTGKTYTIGTEPKYCNEESQGGILERVVKDVLSRGLLNNASVMISFMEIYNEEAYDLLGENSKKLVVQGLTVQNLTCLEVTQYEEAKQYLMSGASNRHTRSTKMNACSSRSHAIFTVYYRQQRGDHEMESRMNLVDLAGSESVRNTGNKGDALVEANNINKGLLQVGRVISSLSEKHSEFVCYRSSLLTSVLKDSLSQQGYITMIACISPSSRDIGQTLNTLRFAEQAKKVMAKPKISSLIEEYKTSNPVEFEQMSLTMEQISQTPSVKLNKAKQKPGFSHPRKPFGPYNFLHSTPSMANAFKRPNLNLSGESTASSHLNMSSVSSFIDPVDLSPIIKRHFEEAEKDLLKQIPVLIRSELQRAYYLQENEAMKENFSTLQNTYQMSLHEDSSDLSRTAHHNNIRRSTRLAQKNLLHSVSTVHSDKSTMTEEVNNTVVPNIIKRANISLHEDSSALYKTALHSSIRKSTRLAQKNLLHSVSTVHSDTSTMAMTEEANNTVVPNIIKRANIGSCKTSANTTEISIVASTVSPPYSNRGSINGANAYEKNEFSKWKEEAAVSHVENVSIPIRRTSKRIQSLKEKQNIRTKDRADYPKKSPQIYIKKPQASLHAVSQKSRKIAKHNCTCISSKELISYALNLSPVTRVKKHILDLLNGTIRDIVKLPTVGPKRGFIIYNYRLIKDSPFTKIEELNEIPGLPRSFYQQFVQANCMAFMKDEKPRT